MILSEPEAAIIRQTIAELRRLALVEVQAPGIRKVVLWGHRCKVCGSKWSTGQPEHHLETCLLEGSQP